MIGPGLYGGRGPPGQQKKRGSWSLDTSRARGVPVARANGARMRLLRHTLRFLLGGLVLLGAPPADAVGEPTSAPAAPSPSSSTRVRVETVRTEAAGLRFSLPRSWTRVPTGVETRAAQYALPHADGDGADTELVLSFLGEGKGGSPQENLDRWYARFVEPDGRPPKEAAVVSRRTVRSLTVTAVDLSGTYVGESSGSIRGGVSGFRLLGAVVEGSGGPWFFQILGPAASVGRATADFDALLNSLEPHR